MISVRYLHSAPLFSSPGLRIRGVGIQERMLPCIVQRERGTGDYLLMIFHDDARIGRPPGGAIHPPGTLVAWSPKDGHYYGNPQRPWSHSWIHCDGPAVARMLKEARVPLARPVRLPDPSRADKYLFDLHDEISRNAEPDPVIVRNCLHSWVREIGRAVHGGGGAAVPERMLRVKALLDVHYARKVALDDLAEKAGLSVPHFCAEFKRHFGVPAVAYALRRRLHAAAFLLRDTGLSVTEVGRRVGYDDPYYFSRHFKRYFGVSPKHLRQGKAVQ